jgi:prephenate dehydrogenase
MKWKKITIIGLGLIGSSLAWALKKSGQVGEVFGVDINEETVGYAARKGIIDSGSKELEDAVKHSDVVVIATYVSTIPTIARTVSSSASEGTIVTDVGSVKEKIVKAIEDFFPPHLYFVGGHPIAGTERSGVEASDSDLFRGKRCILTPTPKTNPEALARVKNLWESVGSRVFSMDVETHDRVFAFVSHLPHVVAYALLNSIVFQEEPENLLEFAGGGLRDYTRIGASSPEMWSSIFLSNKENILEAIREFKKAIKAIERMIEREDWNGLKEELEIAARVRDDIDK